MTAIAIINRDTIIQRIANGEFLLNIANDLGIAPPNVSKHLANDPEYQAARELGAESRLVEAYTKLASAEQDGIKQTKYGEEVDGNLVRAREAKWKAAAWFAEREFAGRWGAKQEVTHHQAAPQLNITVVSGQQIAPQHDVIDGAVSIAHTEVIESK